MEALNYQFEDFLASVDDEYKDFVVTVNELLLQEGCKVKIAPSKTSIFTVKYTQGKTRRGMLNFTLNKKGLRVSLFAGNFEKYPDVLNNLHENMASAIAKSPICKNMMGPKKCSWADCIGYNIYIGKEHYQKCRYSCFQFYVDVESIPSLLNMLKSEIEARRIA